MHAAYAGGQGSWNPFLAALCSPIGCSSNPSLTVGCLPVDGLQYFGLKQRRLGEREWVILSKDLRKHEATSNISCQDISENLCCLSRRGAPGDDHKGPARAICAR